MHDWRKIHNSLAADAMEIYWLFIPNTFYKLNDIQPQY